MQVNLKEHTLEQVQELLPVRMTGRDLDFVVDWLVWVGWSMVKVSMEKHPGMTLGHLIALTLDDKRMHPLTFLTGCNKGRTRGAVQNEVRHSSFLDVGEP